jgi:putative colanic acid biosynthesis UDP-glucose lipid carrier transferase
MSHPILPRRPFLIALLSVAEPLLPWAAAYLAWQLLLPYGGLPVGLADRISVILELCALLLVQSPASLTVQISARSVAMATSLAVRWAALCALAFAIRAFTDQLNGVPALLLARWLFLTLALMLVTSILLRRLVRLLLRDAATVRSVVFAGCNETSRLLEDRLRNNPGLHMQVRGYFDDRGEDRLVPLPYTGLIGKLTELPDYVRQNHIDVIFIALPMSYIRRVQHLMDALHDTTVSVYYVPGGFAFDLIQSRPLDIDGVPVVALCETPFLGYGGVFKRLFDIVVTSLIMIPAAPVMLAIAALIRMTSHGPALFRQTRYGLDGAPITVYKFRSMKVMEDGPVIRQASATDDRITPLGAFLRKSSLDELPQLINVLQGQMSLVGPRPHAVAHNETYRRLIKGYMLRHKVQPGITGLAQVRGWRGETQRVEEMEARVRCDLDYLRDWSPMLDIKIMVLTALRLVTGDKRAY